MVAKYQLGDERQDEKIINGFVKARPAGGGGIQGLTFVVAVFILAILLNVEDRCETTYTALKR